MSNVIMIAKLTVPEESVKEWAKWHDTVLAEHLKFPGCISAIRYRITGNRSIDLSGKGADLNEPFNFMSVYVFESSDAARAWNGSPGHKKVMAERNPTFEQGMIGITGAEDS